MGYQDRAYFRDRGNVSFNPLTWLLYGSVPLFTVFDIRVRAHASLVLTTVFVLLFGWGPGFGFQNKVGSAGALFVIILLHEFGHCFTARWVGGEAHDILMHPLGGVAMAQPPRRPWPTFLTVAGGPAVNVAICLLCAIFLALSSHRLPIDPFFPRAVYFPGWLSPTWYAYWIYEMSYMLLVFNLLPIFPLDGGQMLQAALWKPLGYRKSMTFSCVTGMIACVIFAMIAIAAYRIDALGLLILAGLGFYTCLRMYRFAKYESGDYEEYTDGIDYSAAYDINAGRARPKPRNVKRVQKLKQDEASERVRIDAILDKVSAQGMQSLTRGEKRELGKATDKQRKRDIALGRRVK